MLRNRDIRQLQQILLMRKIVVYLLVLRYIQFLHELQGKEQENKVVSFAYDPFGRRISKSVHREEIDDDNDSDDEDDIEKPRAVYYVYDNEDIIMEYNHRGKVTARYTHGLGIDEPLSVEKKHHHTYYYHADGLGSIIALSDERGRTVQTYDYDSFGGFKKHGDKGKDMHAFTGRIWDRDIKLYDYRNRMYDPKIGRFISYDPSLSLRGSPDVPYLLPAMLRTPQEFNAYQYVGNNPVNFVDPLGLYTMPGGELYTKCMENAPKNCKDEYNNCMNKCKSNSNQCSEEKWKDPLNRSCEMICTDEFIGCFTKKTVISTYCDFLYKPRIRGK